MFRERSDSTSLTSEASFHLLPDLSAGMI
jgi:hypothetical protein